MTLFLTPTSLDPEAIMKNVELLCSYYEDVSTAANENWECIHICTYLNHWANPLKVVTFHQSICLKGIDIVKNTQLCKEGNCEISGRKLKMLQHEAFSSTDNCYWLHKNQGINKVLNRGDRFLSKTKQTICLRITNHCFLPTHCPYIQMWIWKSGAVLFYFHRYPHCCQCVPKSAFRP